MKFNLKRILGVTSGVVDKNKVFVLGYGTAF